jgi:Response regulator containing CheY-like receiver, AAA-type ATPase, and DNA-binding domains
MKQVAMDTKARILVVDDEAPLRLLLSKELSREGYFVDVAADGETALARVREDLYHVILLDIVMPGMDGISLLRKIRAENIISEVIILTGNATIESAIETIKLGAFEYVRKPYQLPELIIQIERAVAHQVSQLDRQILKRDLNKTTLGGKIIGESVEIKDLCSIIKRVASTQSIVLILGESGTGKELVARTIHEQSARSDKQFVAVSCAALPPNLLESELFGHEKGAFTDAKTQKRGLAETADGGTLFLDEIGEIPVLFQAKLLRFLETGEIRRVGGTKDIHLNVRILCATNRPLESLVDRNEFRADLYYRLSVFTIHVPALKNHRDDIPLLVENIISLQGFHKKFDKAALEVLKSYDWPGNVRELRNVVERACILGRESIIGEKDISFLAIKQKITPSMPAQTPTGVTGASLKDVERLHIINVLQQVNGHKGKAARILKINPKTLYRKMKDYSIVSVFE